MEYQGIINVILVALGLLCIGAGLIVGFLRGVVNTTVKLIRIIASALLALPLTVIITTIMGENAVALGSTVLSTFGIDLESESPNLAAASGSLLSAVSAVFVYFIVVVILLLFLLLITACLKKLFDNVEAKLSIPPVASHGFGFLIGLIAGVLLFAVLTLPIVGVSHTVNETVTTLQAAESCPLDDDTLQTVADSTQAVLQSPVCRLSWTFPQKQLYLAVTTVKTERGKSTLDEELHAAALIADDVFVLTDSAVSSFGQAQAKSVTHIASSLGNTKMLPSLLAGFLSDASTKWLADESYFGMPAPYVKAPIDIVLKGAYLLFSTTTPDSIEKDLLTFSDMLASLDEAGLLGGTLNEETIMNKISDGSFFELFKSEQEDDRSQILTDSILNAVIKTVADEFGYDATVEEARQQLELYTGKVVNLLAQTQNMTREERQNTVADTLLAQGAELGFDIPADVAEAAAGELLDRFGDQAPENLSLTDFLPVLAAACLSQNVSF